MSINHSYIPVQSNIPYHIAEVYRWDTLCTPYIVLRYAKPESIFVHLFRIDLYEYRSSMPPPCRLPCLTHIRLHVNGMPIHFADGAALQYLLKGIRSRAMVEILRRLAPGEFQLNPAQRMPLTRLDSLPIITETLSPLHIVGNDLLQHRSANRILATRIDTIDQLLYIHPPVDIHMEPDIIRIVPQKIGEIT